MDSENIHSDLAGDAGDWGYALEVAIRDGVTSVPAPGECPITSFEHRDIRDVLASAEGENDVANWIALVTLRDGRFAFISAWCDYTGWGCQDGGRVVVSSTFRELLQFGLDADERARLGLKLVYSGVATTAGDEPTAQEAGARRTAALARHLLCPCGSGKSYGDCHGPQEEMNRLMADAKEAAAAIADIDSILEDIE